MNIKTLFNYLFEIIYLFLEMAPFLIMGFIISGLLYKLVSKDTITNNLGDPGLISVIKATILGVPMPLCSCGVIPVTASLYKRGASKGASLSFLISTPQTGIDSILITYGMLGPIFAVIRPIIALFTGIIGGLIAEITINDDYSSNHKINHSYEKKTFYDALVYAFITLPQDIVWPLIKGILLAALISILVPENFFNSYGIIGLPAMFLMAIISIPMYVCATASVPIAAGLILTGNLEPGAAFVFLMAGPATNIATITVIKKTLGNKIVYIYLSTIFIFSIIFGLLINKYINFNKEIITHHMHHDNLINILSAFILLFICIYTLKNKFLTHNKIEQKTNADLTLIVKGMTCNHCKETVTEAINSCDGINNIEINLESGQAFIFGDINENQIIKSINNAGFSIGKNK